MFAASAGLYPKIGGRSFNYIAQTDLLVVDKSRQAHPVWRVFALVYGVIVFVCFCHAIHLLAFVVNRSWYAAAASSKGGTTEARRGIDA